ncbi:hypothetical protein V5O48_018489, partial [Marasmius crinis-equi]
MAIPWNRKDVESAAIQYFKDRRNEFTKFLDGDNSDYEDSDDAHSEYDSDTESDDSDDDSDSGYSSDDHDSDSDSDTPQKKKKRSRSRKHSSKKDTAHTSLKVSSRSSKSSSKKKGSHSSKTKPLPSVSDSTSPGRDDKQLDELVEKLAKLNLEDPEYALTYYRAVKLDPEVKGIFTAPVQRKLLPLPRNSFQSGKYAPPGNSSDSSGRQRILCSGCGGEGHGLATCNRLVELVQQGKLKRENNKYVWPSGEWIRRLPGEQTLLEAYERLKDSMSPAKPTSSTTSNLVHAFPSSEYASIHHAHLISPSASDEEIELALNAQKDKIIKGKVRDEPYKTARDRHSARSKDKEAENTVPAPDGSRVKLPPKPSVVIPPFPLPKPVPRPIDPSPQHFDSSNDDAIMEDITNSSKPAKKSSSSPSPAKTTPSKDAVVPKAKRAPAGSRQSDISISVDKDKIVQHLLETTGFPITIRELLACSPELSNKVNEMTCFKNTRPTESTLVMDNSEVNLMPVSASAYLIDRHMLIKLHVMIDSRPIEAIVDTGSMLNIVRHEIWKSSMGGRAMDVTKSMGVFDANAGKGLLQGRLDRVPVDCGSAKTFAQIYVGAHVPFDLLLGRPWQRGNFVSIDERDDGTFLLFKRRNEHGDLIVQYEVLVEMHEAPPNWASHVTSFVDSVNDEVNIDDSDEETDSPGTCFSITHNSTPPDTQDPPPSYSSPPLTPPLTPPLDLISSPTSSTPLESPGSDNPPGNMSTPTQFNELFQQLYELFHVFEEHMQGHNYQIDNPLGYPTTAQHFQVTNALRARIDALITEINHQQQQQHHQPAPTLANSVSTPTELQENNYIDEDEVFIDADSVHIPSSSMVASPVPSTQSLPSAEPVQNREDLPPTPSSYLIFDVQPAFIPQHTSLYPSTNIHNNCSSHAPPVYRALSASKGKGGNNDVKRWKGWLIASIIAMW